MRLKRRTTGRAVVIILAWLLILASGILLAVGAIGARCDACDLANIGFPYWCVLALVGTGALAVGLADRRHGGWQAAATAAVLLVAAQRDAIPRAALCQGDFPAARLRIVSFNAWTGNPTPERAARWIVRQRPDVVILAEAKGNSVSLPALLARDFPYRQACSDRLFCSTWVLSRLPPIAGRALGRGDVENRQGLSAATMRIPIAGGASVTVVGVHLSRPLPLGRQRRELALLQAALSSGDSRPIIVAGDFNATQDSRTLAAFAAALDLNRVPTGATWPVGAASVPSMIAIDNILVSHGIGQALSRVGPDIGSDHQPLLAELCVNQPMTGR